MDTAPLAGQLATSVIGQTIPEEPHEGGNVMTPQSLSYTFSETTPPESHPSPCGGGSQTALVLEGVAEREETEGDERCEQEDEKAAEEVDSSPVESTVSITRHPQKNTFGVKFEASGCSPHLYVSLVSGNCFNVTCLHLPRCEAVTYV